MADASFYQTSFLGGEWSPLVQGRMDDQRYRTALNVSRNMIPIEEGSHSRRPGTRLMGPTRRGQPGVLRKFEFTNSHPYNLELTANHLRFLAGGSIVVESAGTQAIVGVSTGNPCVITTMGAHGWASNDEVVFAIAPGEAANSTLAPLLGRQISIAVLSSTTFSCYDALTGLAVQCPAAALGSTDLSASRIATFATPYGASELAAINTTQGQTAALGNFLMLLHNNHQPQQVTSTNLELGSSYAAFNVSPVTFQDGPYFDIPTDGSTITPSGASGSITLTASKAIFAPTDIGRHVRVFSEPALYDPAHTYAKNDQVKYNGAYYQSLAGSNVGNEPDTSILQWAIATTAAVWMWGPITAYTSPTAVTMTLQAIPNVIAGTTNPTALPRTTACTYQLGLYSDTTGWPASGCYTEGRLFLAGAQPNRFDASMSNQPFVFSPTGSDGTVADANALAEVFNSDDANEIYWMMPDKLGVVAGTQGGEYLISASSTNDPLTPTSIQARRQTKFGAANVPAIRTGMTITFVQRMYRKVLEYITTDFRGLAGKNISITGKHLATKGIAELAYQREINPILWARTNDGKLIGCTYRRENFYASDPPDFSGWHRHDFGNPNLKCISIQAGPNIDGTLDALSMICQDSSTGYCYNMLLTDFFDVDWQIADAMFVDQGLTPAMWEIITGPPKVVRLYSLWYLAGQFVDVFLGGIDCGTLQVQADGHLDVPLDSTTIPLLTTAYLNSLTSTTNFHGLQMGFLQLSAPAANQPAIGGVRAFEYPNGTSHSVGWGTVDWDGRRLYTGSPAKLMVHDIDSFEQVTLNTTLVGGNPFIHFGVDGYLYVSNQVTNCSQLLKIDPNRLESVSQFGAVSSQLNSDATHLAFTGKGCTVKAGPYTMWVQAGLSTNEQTVLNCGPSLPSPQGMTWTGWSMSVTENGNQVAVIRARPKGPLGHAQIFSWTSTTLGCYDLLISPLNDVYQTKPWSLTPAQINPAWTGFSLQGVCVDETDWNLIMSFAGTPSGTALVKVNSVTGAIIWNIQTLLGNFGGQIWQDSRIRGGQLGLCTQLGMGTVNDYYQINTITGAIESTTALNNFCANVQSYCDTTGQIIMESTYFYEAGQIPQPIGDTPQGWNPNYYFAQFGPANGAWPPATAPSAGAYLTVPAAIGYAYKSQGQILRAVHPQEAGAQNGPAVGKTRRSHMAAALVQQTQGIKFGTTFDHLHTATLSSPGGNVYAATSLFSGIWQDTLDDDYTFDSMLCWQIDRPYPATVCAVEPFLHTQDR